MSADVDYRTSHLDPEHARSYHKEFERDPYRKMAWLAERSILDAIVRRFFDGATVRHLDFACGTGRILSHLRARMTSSTGVDISPAMLEIARSNNPAAEIFEADLTRDDVLNERVFDLVTAFRFFPNAQPALRREVMRVLARHVERGGYLVFNNHKNASSSTYRIARLFGRGGRDGMSTHEVEELLRDNGLEIAARYHYAVLPTIRKVVPLPFAVVDAVERILARVPFLWPLAEDVIFVCRLAAK